MNGILQLQHDQRREIIYKGQLQQKVMKKCGTLFRRKRVIYDDELWVVLCVHEGGNGGIPHMEWYDNPRSIYDHRPRTVQDLLDCQYVNVAIGEERCIVIGFVDKNRPVLELSAPSLEERKQWIDKLTSTLRRLNCLLDGNGDQQDEGTNACCPRAENEYVALNYVDKQNPKLQPVINASPSTSTSTNRNEQLTIQAQKLSLRDIIPMHSLPPTFTSSLSTQVVMANERKSDIAHEGDDNEVEHLLPPPLPPRKGNQDPEQQTPLLPSSPIPSSPPTVSHMNFSPEEENLVAVTVNSRFDDFPSYYDKLIPNQSHQYQQLSRIFSDFSNPQQNTVPACMRLSHISSSSNSTTTNDSTPTTSNSTRNSDSGTQITQQLTDFSMPLLQKRFLSGAQYDILNPSLQHYNLPFGNNFMEHIFLENMFQPRKISLALSLLVENVAFVDNGKKLWIAGWNSKVDANLRNILHFGDEVIKMSGIEIQNIQQLSGIYANTRPGVPIELLLCANSRAKVFVLEKTENPKKDLGIVLHKKKNKIASIERNSPAERCGIPTHLPSYFFNPSPHRDEVSAIITELDGIPMNLYARNEQLFQRVEQTRIGSSINMTIHPEDFCNLIANKLKTQKNFHHFVHYS